MNKHNETNNRPGNKHKQTSKQTGTNKQLRRKCGA